MTQLQLNGSLELFRSLRNKRNASLLTWPMAWLEVPKAPTKEPERIAVLRHTLG
jgi:hypothetical protein